MDSDWKVNKQQKTFFSIKITEESIEQKQLVNDSIQKIEITKKRKIKDYINDFMIIANFIL